MKARHRIPPRAIKRFLQLAADLLERDFGYAPRPFRPDAAMFD